MRKRRDVYQKVATKIREFRGRRGLTQERLAFEAGLNRAYIGYIERGERKPSLETLAKIADALGVELYELFRF